MKATRKIASRFVVELDRVETVALADIMRLANLRRRIDAVRRAVLDTRQRMAKTCMKL